MRPGDYLDGENGDQGRFRIEEAIATGRTHEVILCSDTERDSQPVVAKAPVVDPDSDSPSSVRFEALQRESELLDASIRGFPERVAMLEVDSLSGTPVPVLIYEYLEGTTLYDYIVKRPRKVLRDDSLAALLHEVGRSVEDLHERGSIYRDLDPRHVVVGEDGVFQGFVGVGNVTPSREPPIRPSSDYVDAPYVAPEARQERSGETLRPEVDVYSLAALTSFVFTGEEPLSAVESPLNARAYELLNRSVRSDLAALVAAGLQPVAKHRLEFEEILRHLDPEGPLFEPGEATKSLPEPWSGARPPGENRAEQSALSAGPLISVEREPAAEARGARGAIDGGEDGVRGVKSEPVREFLGETDRVGMDETGAEEVEEDAAEEGERDSNDIRRNEDGTPAKEINMSEEHLDGEAGEPDRADLPLRTRLFLGIGLPFLVMLTVVLLGLLGVY